MHGTSGGAPSLRGIELLLDRGYPFYQLHDDYLLPAGGHILGTVMRSVNGAFTYDQQLRDGDHRELIPQKGPKDLLLKHRKAAGGKQVTASAYRSGTGTVTLGMSTKYPNHHWDFVLKNPRDATWYRKKGVNDDGEEIESSRPFQELRGNSSFLDELKGLQAEALTTGQNFAEWFFFHGYRRS